MGLRCSLLGHDWSETEIEDERDEQGNEVVMTVREYEVCARCGEKTLISENTEVTSVSNGQPTDSAAEPADDADTVAAEVVAEATADEADAELVDDDEPDVAVESEGETDDDAETEDAEVVDDEAVDGDDEPASPDSTPDDAAAVAADDDAMIIDGDDEPEPAGDAVDAEADTAEATATDADDAGEFVEDAPADPHENPETDDGVILPGDGSEPEKTEREHGEWPEHEGGHANATTEAREWPDHGDEDDGFDATAPDGEAADVEFEGGHPQTDAEGKPEKGHDAEFIDNTGAQSVEQEVDQRARSAASNSPTGIASANEARAPGTGSPSRSGGDLVCPACDNTELAARTSLRAGDICPECKRGYLAEE
ncbi:hypothetical protein [Haloarchaeobius sp. HME9146]|uniref:DUF7093 family protein n=1 Tax=Haloarchaeobius sp. HME9146 TaxID=2978732 RepID=UPI0021C221AE|nr:hypothetical protein [Haloarchaeobius sp. HME9146]MCT9095384.1 hypothetical protein [Haloarchaeobius sp. HME9146]